MGLIRSVASRGRRHCSDCWDVTAHWHSLFVVHPSTAVLDGWRGLSMLLVFVFHLFFTMQEFVPVDAFQGFYHQTHWALLWVWAGDRGVDIFFVLSGFLIGSSLLREYKASGEVCLTRFWCRRILRLAPVYYAILCVYWAASGPNADYIWANFLYLNNFLAYENGAVLWSWSLAVEMQFYFLLPLFLVLGFFSYRNWVRWLVIVFVFAVAVVLRVWVLYFDERLMLAESWQFLLDKPTFKHFFAVFYDGFETRFGSLWLGFVAAYLVVFHGDVVTGFFRKKVSSILVWVALGLVILLTVLPGLTYRMASDASEMLISVDAQFRFVYLVSHRYLYSAAVAVLMVYSLMGRDWGFSVVQRVLSLRYWAPFARLSYSIYLVHIMVIFAVYKYSLTPENAIAIGQADYGAFSFGLLAAVSALLTIVLALALYIFVERPFMQLRD